MTTCSHWNIFISPAIITQKYHVNIKVMLGYKFKRILPLHQNNICFILGIMINNLFGLIFLNQISTDYACVLHIRLRNN
jgi:hypothetical protein